MLTPLSCCLRNLPSQQVNATWCLNISRHAHLFHINYPKIKRVCFLITVNFFPANTVCHRSLSALLIAGCKRKTRFAKKTGFDNAYFRDLSIFATAPCANLHFSTTSFGFCTFDDDLLPGINCERSEYVKASGAP